MADMPAAGQIEDRFSAEKQTGSSAYWAQQLELSHSDHESFLKEGVSVIERYKGERKSALRSNPRRFNILYSNTETLKAALFAQMAKPEVKRRFSDQDPIGRQVAEIIERAASYTQDVNDSEHVIESAISDYLLPGRGVARVCYEAETASSDSEDGTDAKEYVSKQELYEEYVNWQDFRHEPAKTWDKVTWEAFRHKMSRDNLSENFPDLSAEEITKVPLTWSPSPDKKDIPDAFKRAEVWEIWDKTNRQRVWVVPGYDKVLRTDDDPYGLEEFFPNPEPLQAIVTNETVIPQAEFSIYQDQADGLDEIEGRIDRLTKALKRRGVYDATFKELQRLAKANDNEFVPVKNYSELSQKGGLAAAFQSEDLTTLASVLQQLHQQRDLRVQTIYEVVGIADIMRGSSDPRETLGAQKIKAQFGSNRLKKRQDKVQKWIRDLLRIKCEIIAEHFEPNILAEITGFKLADEQMMLQMQQAAAQGQPISLQGIITPQIIRVLRDDKLRSYHVDIETDSTIYADEQAEKQAATEMITSVSQFVASWEPILQAQPALIDLAFSLLEFGLRRFKPGRTLEDVFEQAKVKIQQSASQPRPPDPKVQAEQGKMQAEQARLQFDQQQAQVDSQQKQRQIELDGQFKQQQAQINAELEWRKAQLSALTSIEVARIGAKTDTDSDELSAELEAALHFSTQQHEKEMAALQNGGQPSDGNGSSSPPVKAKKPTRDEQLHSTLNNLADAIKQSSAPKRVVRGPDGRISHVEPILN